MRSKKPDFRERVLPRFLDNLPRFGISRTRPNSRELSKRSEVDIAFGVESADDLVERLERGFARVETPSPKGRGPIRKRK